MEVSLGPLARGEVRAAAALIAAGTLTPGVEDLSREDDYWFAADETRRRGGEIVVARVGDEVVGVCQIMVLRHFQHTGGLCGEIESVYVREDQRSRGVGAAMVAWAEDFARERGCYRVQLTSRTPRVDAHRFYQRLGYEQTSLGFKKSLVDGDLA